MGVIGVFDSGVGGLSVLQEIRRELPGETLFYVADSGHAPYGDRPEAFVVARSEAIADFLIQSGATAMVVACNTATAAAVDALRASHTLPIVGVEPGVKPAASASRTAVVGVLTTSRTARSSRFARLLDRVEGATRFIVQACPGWVELVERGALEGDETERAVRQYVEPLLAAGADALVLGCTHYSFLSKAIREVAGGHVTLIDPAAAVARHLRRRLEDSGLLESGTTGRTGGQAQVWTSGDVSSTSRLVAQLWGESLPVLPLPAAFAQAPAVDLTNP